MTCPDGKSCIDEDRSTTCATPPIQDFCGDGVDNDCDGQPDNFCPVPPPTSGPPNNAPNAPHSPDPGDNDSCHDRQGGPVDMATGNVLYGPVALVSQPTSAGSPLLLELTYNSMGPPSAFGTGWTLNLSQHLFKLDDTTFLYRDAHGGVVRFPAPQNYAADETSSGDPAVFLSSAVVRALDGSNLGLYDAVVRWDAIPHCPRPLEGCGYAPVTAKRVRFEDGSRAVFGVGGELLGIRDRFGNQTSINPAPDPLSAHLGLTSAEFSYSSTSVDISVNNVARVKLVLDSSGLLTDICDALSAGTTSLNDCRRGPGSAPCLALQMRTLYHFDYQAVLDGQGLQVGPRRLSSVQDESCKVIEEHRYAMTDFFGVVATTSFTASESLLFGWHAPVPPFPDPSVSTSLYLRPGDRPLPEVFTHLDGATRRVRGTGELCGPALSRTWATGPTGPRVSGYTLAKQTVTLGHDGAADPFHFGMPVTRATADGTGLPFTPPTPQREEFFVYGHPAIARPTVVSNGARKVTYDFDDDDPNFPCDPSLRSPGPGDVTVPNEHPTAFLCHVTEESLNGTATTRKTHYQYDAVGHLLSMTSPADTTQWRYYEDASQPASFGLLKSVTRSGSGTTPTLTTTYKSYGLCGLPQVIIEPGGDVTQKAGAFITSLTYDSRCRVHEVTSPDASTTRTEYLSDGRPSLVVLPRGNSVEYRYDERGRLSEELWHESALLTSAVIQRRVTTFDLGGNPMLVEEFDKDSVRTRSVRKDFDHAHRVVKEYGTTMAISKTSTYVDWALTQVVDEAGHSTRFDFDGLGNLRKRHDANGTTESLVYDARGNLTAVSDGNGNETRYTYDDFDLVRGVETPNSGLTAYLYTDDGLVAAWADQQLLNTNHAVLQSYDGLRRLLRKDDVQLSPAPGCGALTCLAGRTPQGAPSMLETWTWDTALNGLGRPAEVKNAGRGGSATWSYDGSGRVVSEERHHPSKQGTVNVPLGFDYFPGGALRSLTYTPQQPGTPAPVLSYERAADDSISSVTFNGIALAKDVRHFPFGGLRHFVRGNGLATDIQTDALGRRRMVSGEPVTSEYALGPAGEVQSVFETGDVYRKRTFGYDGVWQLTAAKYQDANGQQTMRELYTYDGAGNRLTRVRNDSKLFTSVFDVKADGVTPANDLLRAILDPSLDAGTCVAVSHGSDEDGERDDDEGPPGEHNHRDHHGQHHGHGGDDESTGRGGGDGGTSQLCLKPSPRDLKSMVRDWKHLLERAEQLVESLPRKSPDVLRTESLDLLDVFAAWMRAYDVPPQGLIAATAVAAPPGQEDFLSLLQDFLARRATLGNVLERADLQLLRKMVESLEHVDVRDAVEKDPSWLLAYDASGRVVERRVQIPDPVRGTTLSETTYCTTYDALGRETEVSMLTRRGSQLLGAPPPCSSNPVVVATYGYDEAARRVYRRDAVGIDTWEVRGSSGELLGELQRDPTPATPTATVTQRAFIYLDGEPLAQAVLTPGYSATAPPVTGGGTGCSSTAGSPVLGALPLLLALAFLRRRRAATLASGAALALSACGGGDIIVDAGTGRGPPSPGTVSRAKDPIYYYHNDRLGTPIRMTDEAGQTVWRAEYQPFGGLESLENNPDGDNIRVENPLRFPGQYDDALTSLLLVGGPYYNWHRYYAPDLGRYSSPEPQIHKPDWMAAHAWAGQRVPSFSYASSNPVSNIDPTGLGCMSTYDCCLEHHPENPSYCGPAPAPQCGPQIPHWACRWMASLLYARCLASWGDPVVCGVRAAEFLLKCMGDVPPVGPPN